MIDILTNVINFVSNRSQQHQKIQQNVIFVHFPHYPINQQTILIKRKHRGQELIPAIHQLKQINRKRNQKIQPKLRMHRKRNRNVGESQ